MRKSIYLSIYLSICVCLTTNAQITTNSQWTWMKGDSTTNLNGVYGTQGVSSSNNKPGSRENGVTWTDASGNLWLFGGRKYNEDLCFNDLWKYNITSNQWTWMKGDAVPNQVGIYGTKGIASSTNKPGSRFGSATWVDGSGNLWLFGGDYNPDGFSKNQANDLWKYNITSNQWTWISGDSIYNQFGVYGNKGVASNSNNPGSRVDPISWTDNLGNFWLFGGLGYAKTTQGFLNDLWNYNISSNQWTWINGDSISNQYTVYGNKNISNSTNKPGARIAGFSIKDASGNFWLMGGNGLPNSGNNGYLNDLWKYNIATNQWSWVSGDSSRYQYAIVGSLGVSNSLNKIGARMYGYSWKDIDGSFMFFSGFGRSNNPNGGYLNDLWKYNVSTNEWTWLKGDTLGNSFANYGSKGVTSSSNKPGGRGWIHCWVDLNNNLWTYGGWGYTTNGSPWGQLNDLWRLGVDPLPVVLNKFIVEKNARTAILKWSTASEINNKYFEVQRSIDGKEFSTIGIVEAKGFASEYLFKDEKPFVGINYYRLKQVDNDGKYSYSETKSVKFDGDGKLSFVIYPNPTKEKVNVFVNAFSGKGEIIVTDLLGKQIKQQVLVVGNNSVEINNLTKGIYFVNIITEKEKQTQKLVVE
jgi:N-acetylneuraminic acid mutarotase